MSVRCRLHGRAFTYGCSGCSGCDAAEDASDYLLARSRTRWYRVESLCRRYVGHWNRELEPGVTLCRVCGSLTFSEADEGAMTRWLLGKTRRFGKCSPAQVAA